MGNSKWPQISQVTLADRIYQVVRDRILDGDLEPGEYIREQDLSEAMGVSRTPVREALGRLGSESFLERIPHRGFRVPEESFKDLLELYPIVGRLESLAAELAFPELNGEDLVRLREINEELREAVEREDARAEMEANRRFHRYIADRSGNERLAVLLDDLISQVARLEIWYYSSRPRAEQSVREHEELIEALADGDVELALELTEGHMPGTTTALDEELAGKAAAEREAATAGD